MTSVSPDDSEIQRLLVRLSAGDDRAKTELFSFYRNRLSRLVERHMNPRLGPRFDPSDVVQETLVIVDRELPAYLREPKLPFTVWIYRITRQRMLDSFRRHQSSQRRSVRKEQALEVQSDASGEQLAACLVANDSGPLSKLIRSERVAKLRTALSLLKDEHRELLCLRYLDGLSISEVSGVLGISIGAAKMRQLRALENLKGFIDQDA